MNSERRVELVQHLIGKNYLVQPDVLSLLDKDFNYDLFYQNSSKFKKQESSKVLTKEEFLSKLKNKLQTNIILEEEHKDISTKREIKHFIQYFRARYDKMRSYLVARPELRDSISISKLSGRKNERVSIIGLVAEKRETKNGNYILKIEDPTGEINILINKNKSDLIDLVPNIVLDEVIGISGNVNDTIIFCNNLFFPDQPIKELKKCPDDIYAAFISDVHVGSDMFLEKEFLRFISWLNGEVGTEDQKEIASKIKYLFIVGDLIDGVGVYPNQDKELTIPDVKAQYDKFAEYFQSLKRDDIHIVVCGGNHDALRIAEPQPKLDRKYASEVYKIKNIQIVQNPAMLTIHKTDKFSGFDILLYHGYSFDYYIANVDKIRNNGGYDRADLVMEFLLQKRHLAPTHGSSLYIPYPDKDPLIIEKIPDFFVTGHIHKSNIGMYKSTSLISGSCWQAKTDFQEKVGHNPDPCQVPIVNLKTRDVKMMRFDNE